MSVYLNTFRKSKAIKMVFADTKAPVDHNVHHYAFCCKAGDEVDTGWNNCSEVLRKSRLMIGTAERSFTKALSESPDGEVLVIESAPDRYERGEQAAVYRSRNEGVHFDCEEPGEAVGMATKTTSGPWLFHPNDNWSGQAAVTEAKEARDGQSTTELLSECEDQAHSNDELFSEMEGEDLTPTWAGLMPALIAVLENGRPEGKPGVRSELMRLAEFADRRNEDAKAKNESEVA